MSTNDDGAATVHNKEKSRLKTARIPIKIVPSQSRLPKPQWIRVTTTQNVARFEEVRRLLREHKLVTVCEEGSCPNIGECFGKGTATFMILGDQCTRRCPFCDVGHGRPQPIDEQEPAQLARVVEALQLKYVVITSVDRDDLRDGGANHFASCLLAIRQQCPTVKIEVLVPDFRGRLELALSMMARSLPDVFNHNLETIPRLYKQARPGANYLHSLTLLQEFKNLFPHIPTKSGIMVGLGETDAEIYDVMKDLRAYGVDMLTVGQYLQPSIYHLPVERYVHPTLFEEYRTFAESLGFKQAACGPLVRSSYHADHQAKNLI